MTLEMQVVCCLCGERHLALTAADRSPGEEKRAVCHDCGFEALHRVTVVYDPDLYELVDTYGDGEIGLRATYIYRSEYLVDVVSETADNAFMELLPPAS